MCFVGSANDAISEFTVEVMIDRTPAGDTADNIDIELMTSFNIDLVFEVLKSSDRDGRRIPSVEAYSIGSCVFVKTLEEYMINRHVLIGIEYSSSDKPPKLRHCLKNSS
jgi:hypothetical protein